MSESFFDYCKKYSPIIDYVVKPLLMAFIGLVFAYHSLWLNANYVKKTDFATQEQVENQKLDIIIQNQIAYREQLATVNVLINNEEKIIDSNTERIRYLERETFETHSK